MLEEHFKLHLAENIYSSLHLLYMPNYNFIFFIKITLADLSVVSLSKAKHTMHKEAELTVQGWVKQMQCKCAIVEG